MSIEGGVCAFFSCLTLVSLRVTLDRESPKEMSSFSLCLALKVHYFKIRIVHYNVKKSSL